MSKQVYSANMNSSDHASGTDATATTRMSNLPPEPTSYRRHNKHGNNLNEDSTYRAPCASTFQKDECVEAMRKHIYTELLENELCPLKGDNEQADLWAALEKVFLQ